LKENIVSLYPSVLKTNLGVVVLRGTRLSLNWAVQVLAHLPKLGGFAMDIRPLHDRIVVKRIEEKEAMQGGLYIPDSAKEKPQEAEVVAVGNGKRGDDGKLIPLDVKVGDRILFGKYSGSDIKINGNEYLIMREDEVLGVLEPAAVAAKK
jgi:chaperonin GroES